jgi:hypothetical protein
MIIADVCVVSTKDSYQGRKRLGTAALSGGQFGQMG